MRANLLILIALLFITASAATNDNSRWGAGYFPNVSLTTQEGKTVHFYDDVLKGKIFVIYLMYTKCQYMCPLETARLVQVQRILGDRVGKDIFFYGLSIDPENDTPEALRTYAAKYHIGPGWTFLTGKKDEIELISKRLGLYSEPDPDNKDGHTAIVLLGNEPAGQFIRNSAVDNPRFLATVIGDFLDSFKTTKPGKNYAEARPINVSKGQYVFANQCAACHTIGHGDTIGPDLLGVTSMRDPVWLRRIIAVPEQMLAEKDPLAQTLYHKYKQVVMPNLNIVDEDVDALISFMETQSVAAKKDVQSGPTQAAPAHAGPGSRRR